MSFWFFFSKKHVRMRLPKNAALEEVRKWQKRSADRRCSRTVLAARLKRPISTVTDWLSNLSGARNKQKQKLEIETLAKTRRNATDVHRDLKTRTKVSYRHVCRQSLPARRRKRAVARRKKTVNRVKPHEHDKYDTASHNFDSYTSSQKFWN